MTSLQDDLLTGKVKPEFGNKEHIKAIDSMKERGLFDEDSDVVYRVEVTRTGDAIFYIQAPTSEDAEEWAAELMDDMETETETDVDELDHDEIKVVLKRGTKIYRFEQRDL